ncbi:peptidase domain-containing ABC transporter [Delftia tsuruhatensis]|uniref:peptidase domain-containing ABC transporter n=1 Tax=Delftia tsuruhatensis TaxID=180282 RepID=UPI0028AC788A|nr:peptidase domain-containing ABC transporter [Delftia tsuruhatensis]
MASLDTLALRWGKHLPVMLQTEAAECGLACLAMVASYHGYKVDVTEMRQRFSVSLKGMNLAQVVQVAHGLRLGTRAVRLERDELQNLTAPCVLHWNLDHFVVLKSVSAHSVVIHDPSTGARSVSFEELSRKFTGVALELWPNPNFEKKEAKPRVRLLGLMGKITGLRRSFFQVLVMGVALQIVALVGPFLLQWTIDNAIVSNDRHLLATLILGFSVVLLMQMLISTGRAWALMHMGTLFSLQWRTNVFSHMLRLPSQFFEKRHLGDVVSRFGSVNQIQQTLTASFFSVILDGLMALSTLVLMLVYSPQLATVVICAMALYGLIRWAWYHPQRNATQEQIVHAARQQSHFLESVRGVQALKLFQKLDMRRAVWLNLFVEQINAGLKSQKLQLFYAQANALLFGAENLLVIWLGATMVMDGHFSVGMFMAFYSYKSQFGSRVGSLIDRLFDLRMLQLHSERLADIVLHPPEEETRALVADECSGRADIEVQAVAYRYGDQEPWILNDLSFSIDEGDSVAIIGPSGCGKSTLFKVLLGMLPVARGSIRVAGNEIGGASLSTLRALSGCVMQDDALFAGSLAENICFFDPHSDAKWMQQCARIAGIHVDIERMPMGYSTLVGDMGTVLSGGQKQRVLLARALYKKPRILFLDEATSHLDVDAERQVNAAIQTLDITRIMIAHRPETIACADRIIELCQGRVINDVRVRPLQRRRSPGA